MKLYIIDCSHSITRDHLERGRDRGFDGLIHYATYNQAEQRARDCADLGLESIIMLPDWAHPAPPMKWHDFPFRNAAGDESYLRGLEQQNLFPCYWYKDPSIMQFVRDRFDFARDLADRIDGAIISTSAVECKMPIRWEGDPDDKDAAAKRFAYWCFSRPAVKAFRKYVGNHVASPASAPAWDTQLQTMRFCQDGMVDRLDDIARVTLEYTQQFWVFCNLHMRSSGDLYKAAGYYYMDEPLEHWRTAFMQREGVEPGFFIPSLYLASPQRRERVHELSDPSGEYRWKFMAGLQCDLRDWRENMLTYGEHAKQVGMAAMCAQWEPMTSPGTEQIVREAVKFIKGE